MLTRALHTLGRTDLKVSAVGLGTAEIGYVYGIGPRDMPDEESAIALLHRAVDLGITFIDTARFYGNAEEWIAASGITTRDGVVIATKCGHALDRGEGMTELELTRALTAEVDESLKTLGVDTIDLVQVHGGTEELIRNGSIISVMQNIKDTGKARFIGISTRGEEAPIAAIESGFFDTIQVAYSIVDQRMATRILPAAARANVGVINRSVLLKGALTPASQYLAPELANLKRHSDEAAQIAREMGIDLPTLAVRFALSNPTIGTVLVGSNKIKNIESAVNAAEAGALPDDVVAKLRNLAIDEPSQVDPKYWPANMISDAKNGKKV
jgi:1-deoxyxylulose-5-phosphate synthase